MSSARLAVLLASLALLAGACSVGVNSRARGEAGQAPRRPQQWSEAATSSTKAPRKAATPAVARAAPTERASATGTTSRTEVVRSADYHVTAAPVSKSDARLGIQTAVSRFYGGLNRHDRKLFGTAIDRTDPRWVHMLDADYAAWLRNYGDGVAYGSVQTVAAAGHRYYRATVEVGVRFGGQRYGRVMEQWVFHETGGAWLLAEPASRELGPQRALSNSGVTLHYYAWDQWQARRVLAVCERALREASSRLGMEAGGQVQVRLLPTLASSPGVTEPGVVGYYSSATPNVLYLRSPGSYGFGTYAAYQSPYDQLQVTATHELTHLLSNRRVAIGSLPDWMTEGLAEWVSGSERKYAVWQALRARALLPLSSLSDFESASSRLELAYGESYELVDYVAHLGGLRAYWTMAEKYEQTGRLDAALQQSVHMDAPTFEKRWQEWLRAKYRSEGSP